MIKTYKVKLKPNKKQQTKMLQFCGAKRFAYNWALSKHLEFVRLCDDFKILCENLNYDILKDINIILDLYENGVININDCNSLETDVLSWYEGLINTNDFIEEIKIIYEY